MSGTHLALLNREELEGMSYQLPRQVREPTFSLASMIFVRVRQSPWKPLHPMTVLSVL